MHSPRWRKVLRDLIGNKGRTALVVLAIAVGVFAFGSVFITQEVLLKNIEDLYVASKPSTVTLYLSDFDYSLVNWVKTQPDVADAGAKSNRSVKIVLENGQEEFLNLFSMPDFSKMNLNLLVVKKGSWPPGSGEIVIERSSLSKGSIFYGDNIKVKTSDDRIHELFLSGVVYDNSGFPYAFTNQMSGFVSWDTLGTLGFAKKFNQLEIATSQNITTQSDADNFASSMSKILEDRGVSVNGRLVFKPKEHWATENSKAFTAILSSIGIFSLILSGFLVVNTVSALLSQQKKQIGIMKAIGANRRQISTLYLFMVCVYGLLALFVALPVGMLLGYGFLKMVSSFLNLDINSFYLPKSVFLMQLLAALLVPMVSALIPVISASKKSVRMIISDYQPSVKADIIDRILAKINLVSRPTLLSLRNVFRKKGRLVLTLGTLVTAGALFMGVINVRSGMYKEMDRILGMYDFEIAINVDKDYSVESLTKKIKEIPNVTSIEARTQVTAERVKSDGTKGTRFNITGLPADTVFSHPVLLSGKWLNKKDKNQIVMTSAFSRDNPDVTVGDNLLVTIENRNYNFSVVGEIAMTGNEIINFSDFETISQIKDKPNLASSFLIKTIPSDAKTQIDTAKAVEENLKRGNINVVFKQTKNDIYASASSQFNFLIFFLLTMAIMVAIVGGLGLAGTMSLNVMERTREIGIMRSIGANDKIIRKTVLTEGLLIGLISFVLSIPLSLPLTFGFCYMIGNAFFERTLVFSFEFVGALIWFTIVGIIAIFASLIPANRASKVSISETLSYE